jgi:hypothetical protein
MRMRWSPKLSLPSATIRKLHMLLRWSGVALMLADPHCNI